MKLSYKPVPGLKIALLENNFIELKAPWLIVKAEIDARSYANLKKLSTNNILAEKILEEESINDVLNNFHDYPFFYICPRSVGFPAGQVSETDLDQSLKKEYLDALGANSQFTCTQEDFTWVLEQAKIPGSASMWDPVAVISCLRIIFNKIDCSIDNVSNLGALLERYLKYDVALFAASIGLIIKNNYVITQKCEESLKPALDLHPALTNSVREFIREERGHDRILLASINSLPSMAQHNIPHPPETDTMMALLKKAATINAVAFLSIIGGFEGESYISHQKLYDLMRQSKSTQGAVRGLEKHDRINQLSKHNLVGIEMAKKLPPLGSHTLMNGLYLFGIFLFYFHSSQKTLYDLVNRRSFMDA